MPVIPKPENAPPLFGGRTVVLFGKRAIPPKTAKPLTEADAPTSDASPPDGGRDDQSE